MGVPRRGRCRPRRRRGAEGDDHCRGGRILPPRRRCRRRYWRFFRLDRRTPRWNRPTRPTAPESPLVYIPRNDRRRSGWRTTTPAPEGGGRRRLGFLFPLVRSRRAWASPSPLPAPRRPSSLPLRSYLRVRCRPNNRRRCRSESAAPLPPDRDCNRNRTPTGHPPRLSSGGTAAASRPNHSRRPNLRHCSPPRVVPSCPPGGVTMRRRMRRRRGAPRLPPPLSHPRPAQALPTRKMCGRRSNLGSGRCNSAPARRILRAVPPRRHRCRGRNRCVRLSPRGRRKILRP
mmetsp:Transcript_14172/g.41577  ORF Transcript_14172/g.41577 Transcript_14172/m.41577 type:complete len:287 (+) Transcript_14172:621-1481(+)